MVLANLPREPGIVVQYGTVQLSDPNLSQATPQLLSKGRWPVMEKPASLSSSSLLSVSWQRLAMLSAHPSPGNKTAPHKDCM